MWRVIIHNIILKLYVLQLFSGMQELLESSSIYLIWACFYVEYLIMEVIFIQFICYHNGMYWTKGILTFPWRNWRKSPVDPNPYDYLGCPPEISTWHSHSSGPEIPCLLQNPLLCSASWIQSTFLYPTFLHRPRFLQVVPSLQIS